MCSASTNGRYCEPSGNVALGQVCDANTKCAPGGLCLKTGASVSTCMAYCASDADCQAPGGLCAIQLVDASGNPIPGLTVCSENCDPVKMTGCPVAGTGCQIYREQAGSMAFYTSCTGAGSKSQGAACTGAADCATGYGCFTIDAQGTKQCLRWCDVAAPSCPAGTSCASLKNNGADLQIGNTKYGACL